MISLKDGWSHRSTSSSPTGYAYYVVCLAAAADRPKIRAFRDWVIESAQAAFANP